MRDKGREELLNDFYVECYEWVTSGCSEENNTFTPSVGLCENLRRWAAAQEMGYSLRNSLVELMGSGFFKASLDSSYPFNKGSRDYKREWAADSHYKNKARVGWLRDHVGDIKERTE